MLSPNIANNEQKKTAFGHLLRSGNWYGLKNYHTEGLEIIFLITLFLFPLANLPACSVWMGIYTYVIIVLFAWWL